MRKAVYFPVFLILSGMGLIWFAEAADPATQTAASPSPLASGSPAPEKKKVKRAALDPNACLTDPAAIEDMQKQRQELEDRAQKLAQREAELLEKQKALEEELERLKAVRADIDKSDVLKKKENEEKVAKLIETIESMSPKTAAQILVGVDENLAVTAMMQLPSPKLAKMMNLMEPAKAARLSERLTGLNTNPLKLEKGGENANHELSNANSAQQRSIARSREPAAASSGSDSGTKQAAAKTGSERN